MIIFLPELVVVFMEHFGRKNSTRHRQGTNSYFALVDKKLIPIICRGWRLSFEFECLSKFEFKTNLRFESGDRADSSVGKTRWWKCHACSLRWWEACRRSTAWQSPAPCWDSSGEQNFGIFFGSKRTFFTSLQYVDIYPLMHHFAFILHL
jgi:hypothetical protein